MTLPTAPFRCPKCHRILGTFDGDVPVVNGLYVKEIHAVCRYCGHELHFTLSGRKFERLVERYYAQVTTDTQP
jgi:hypothetical protein